MDSLKLTIAYDGTRYHGFQRQKNAVGVQQVLENGLGKLFQEPITIVGAGRTDAGVHARGQVVSFRNSGRVPLDKIVVAARAFLPADIAVLRAAEADRDFNARYAALGKRYVYLLQVAAPADPFTRNYCWQISQPPALALMQQAAELIIGEHDFAAFRSAGSSAKTTVRTIHRAEWTEVSSGHYEFIIEGNGFLYRMVRNLVGSMVKVGLGRRTITEFQTIFDSRARQHGDGSAPPQGLYLDEVFY